MRGESECFQCDISLSHMHTGSLSRPVNLGRAVSASSWLLPAKQGDVSLSVWSEWLTGCRAWGAPRQGCESVLVCMSKAQGAMVSWMIWSLSHVHQSGTMTRLRHSCCYSEVSSQLVKVTAFWIGWYNWRQISRYRNVNKAAASCCNK